MNIFEAVERSTLRMVLIRLMAIVLIPWHVVASISRNLYRIMFWSDKRFWRHRVVITDVIAHVEKFFKEVPEEMVENIQGSSMRIWVNSRCMLINQAYVLAADLAVYRLFKECDLTGFVLSVPCRDGRIAYVRFDAQTGDVSQIQYVTQGSENAEKIYPSKLFTSVGNQPTLEKEQPTQDQCSCQSPSCSEKGDA